jgi:5-deoxy-glucuronate isomerase
VKRTAADLHLRIDPVRVTPLDAGWRYCGLEVATLSGAPHVLETGEDEAVIVPLAGEWLTVTVDGESFRLRGRRDVFASVPDYLYVPRDSRAEIASDGPAEIALPTAPARRRLPARLLPANEVAIEVRGAGRATRQVTNFLTPDVDAADRLSCCEVLTPPGNWSSYPPHKHDDASNGIEAELEEIYYFKVEGRDGFGAHRTYDLEEGWDVTVTVESDDVFLVPRGYHGPCMASPDHAMWYLNVLAGPAPERSMAISDDPAHAWVRASWQGQELDPRVPMATAPR